MTATTLTACPKWCVKEFPDPDGNFHYSQERRVTIADEKYGPGVVVVFAWVSTDVPASVRVHVPLWVDPCGIEMTAETARSLGQSLLDAAADAEATA